MSAIEQARAHFGRLAVRTIEVPEWADADGKPLVVYARPMTLHDKARLAAVAAQVGDVEMMAHVLLMKAENAQGEKLFTLEDKHLLLKQVDPNVLGRVAVAITRSATVEEMEKNA